MRAEEPKRDCGTPGQVERPVQDSPALQACDLALAEQAKRLQAIVDNAPFGAHTYRLDAGDRLVFIGYNRKAEELLGFDHGPLLGRTLEEAFPGNAGTETARAYKRVAREGGTWETDEYAYDAEGISGVFEVRAFSIGEARMTVFFRDITERRKLEIEARENRELLRATVEQAAAGIARVSLDGTWLDANDCLCQMLGYTVEELREMRFLDVTHPADSGDDADALKGLASGEIDAHQVEKRYLTKDGRTIWVDVAVTLARDPDGRPAYIVTVARDITAQKTASLALQESERTYHDLFNNTETAMFRSRLDGSETLNVNDKFLELVGLTRDEVVGKPSANYWADPRQREEMVRLLTRDGRVVDFEYKMLNKAGEVRDCITSLNLYADRGVLDGSILDITERKQAERGLLEANARLEGVLKSVVTTMGKVVESRDPYTQGHEVGVARIARAIAGELGMSAADINGIEVAALVHDLGKLRVPAEVLTKPGKLSPLEFELMKEHPRTGYEILKGVDFGWPVAEAVLQHHERMDGSGYPRGLAGDEVSMAARVLGVADVIEAMASHRPYRPALGLAAAIEEITGDPGKYDADVSAACVRLYEQGRIEVENGAGADPTAA